MTDPYSPSPELVEAAMIALDDQVAEAGDYDNFSNWRFARVMEAAVAFHHPDGHPELVPYSQVQELVDAARTLFEFAGEDWMGCPEPRIEDWDRLRAALAPFTQEPHDKEAS